MHTVRYVHSLWVAAVFVVGTSFSHAALVNITNDGTALVGDVSKGALGNNNPSTSFDWLAGQGAFAGKGQVAGYNTIKGVTLPVPIFTDYRDAGNSNEADITGYAYAVLHYGKGRNGIGDGGGIVAYFLDQLIGKITFQSKGLGPNGFGGLSSVRLYKAETPRHHVPDSGATWLLVASSVAGLAWLARRREG